MDSLIESILALAHGVALRQRGEDHLQDVETLHRKLTKELLEELPEAEGDEKYTELADITYYGLQIITRAAQDCSVDFETALRMCVAKYEQRQRNDLSGAPKHTGELEAVMRAK
jgi:predicted house-cleaning noncanonical NTP pyrophosphatase (MazG superfamily)